MCSFCEFFSSWKSTYQFYDGESERTAQPETGGMSQSVHGIHGLLDPAVGSKAGDPPASRGRAQPALRLPAGQVGCPRAIGPLVLGDNCTDIFCGYF